MARFPALKRARKYRHKPLHDGAINILSCPDEVLLNIAEYLHLPGLESLTLMCRRLRDTFSKPLRLAQDSARLSWRDPMINPEEYGYHDFLIQILKREVSPNYTKRLDCARATYTGRTSLDSEDDIETSLVIGWGPVEVDLIRAAIRRSPWIEPVITADELISEMLADNREAVLVLLVPLLKNLSIFLPPDWVEPCLLRQIFSRIARAEINAETDHPELLHKLPLRKLHTLWIGGPYNIFDKALHFISLPSVKTCFLDQTSSNEWTDRERFEALQDLPRSRVSQVYFRDVGTSIDCIKLLVSRFEGPCVLRQYTYFPMLPTSQERFEWLVSEGTSAARATWMKDQFWDHCYLTLNQPDSNNMTQSSGTPSSQQAAIRNVEFQIKYGSCHGGGLHVGAEEHSFPNKVRRMREAGIVASPKWMALTKWNYYSCKPHELEDDTFLLDEWPEDGYTNPT